MAASSPQAIPDDELHEFCYLVKVMQASLQYGFQNFTSEQRSHVMPKLEELQNAIKPHQIFSLFQKSLKQVDRSWTPKGQIEKVVQACCDNRYKEEDIEYIFYRHGGINGLLVLHLGSRFQNALFSQIYALPVKLREELATRCGREEINPLIQAWIDNFDKSRSTYRFSVQVWYPG